MSNPFTVFSHQKYQFISISSSTEVLVPSWTKTHSQGCLACPSTWTVFKKAMAQVICFALTTDPCWRLPSIVYSFLTSVHMGWHPLSWQGLVTDGSALSVLPLEWRATSFLRLILDSFARCFVASSIVRFASVGNDCLHLTMSLMSCC